MALLAKRNLLRPTKNMCEVSSLYTDKRIDEITSLLCVIGNSFALQKY